MPAPTIVLVHGAWGVGWNWQSVAAGLRKRKLEVLVVETLPSASGDPDLGLTADTEFLRKVIDELPGGAILVGHSYGGMVISQVAGNPKVAGAVYLTAFWPKEGESFVDAAGGKLASWIETEEHSGLTRIAVDAIPKVVTAGLNDNEAKAVADHLNPQSLRSFTESSGSTDWGDTPVTYIVCTKDRVIPEQVQRSMATNSDAARIIEIAANHFPMFTAVDDTVEAIAEAAASYRL